MNFNSTWSSHIPLLIKVMQQSEGPVLELGAGVFSTPVLYWLCFDMGREFHSYDDNQKYVNATEKFGTRLTTDWDELPIDDTRWGVVFIDHVEDRRAIDAARMNQIADHVIIHDSQRHLDEYFGYKQIYGLYKYKYVYRKVKPHTTVLSNFKEFHE